MIWLLVWALASLACTETNPSYRRACEAAPCDPGCARFLDEGECVDADVDDVRAPSDAETGR
jgi:hypothetical protein